MTARSRWHGGRVSDLQSSVRILDLNNEVIDPVPIDIFDMGQELVAQESLG